VLFVLYKMIRALSCEQRYRVVIVSFKSWLVLFSPRFVIVAFCAFNYVFVVADVVVDAGIIALILSTLRVFN